MERPRGVLQLVCIDADDDGPGRPAGVDEATGDPHVVECTASTADHFEGAVHLPDEVDDRELALRFSRELLGLEAGHDVAERVVERTVLHRGLAHDDHDAVSAGRDVVERDAHDTQHAQDGYRGSHLVVVAGLVDVDGHVPAVARDDLDTPPVALAIGDDPSAVRVRVAGIAHVDRDRRLHLAKRANCILMERLHLRFARLAIRETVKHDALAVGNDGRIGHVHPRRVRPDLADVGLQAACDPCSRHITAVAWEGVDITIDVRSIEAGYDGRLRAVRCDAFQRLLLVEPAVPLEAEDVGGIDETQRQKPRDDVGHVPLAAALRELEVPLLEDGSPTLLEQAVDVDDMAELGHDLAQRLGDELPDVIEGDLAHRTARMKHLDDLASVLVRCVGLDRAAGERVVRHDERVRLLHGVGTATNYVLTPRRDNDRSYDARALVYDVAHSVELLGRGDRTSAELQNLDLMHLLDLRDLAGRRAAALDLARELLELTAVHVGLHVRHSGHAGNVHTHANPRAAGPHADGVLAQNFRDLDRSSGHGDHRDLHHHLQSSSPAPAAGLPRNN